MGAHSTDDLALMLASADPGTLGRRIKQTRVSKEMTQSELAGTDASVGYISRIEAGLRRPELGLLEKLATRLGLSVVALLTGAPDPAVDNIRVALDHADLSLRGGATAEAATLLDDVWGEVERQPALDTRRRWRYLRALTWEAAGHMEEAIRALEDLLAEDPAPLEAAQTAIALSRCYRETGDLAHAIDLGERFLDRLRHVGLENSTESIQLVVTTAAAHFQRGDVAHAVRLCRRAIDKAEDADNPVAMASAYWNASIMEHERGQSHSAVALASKAIQLLDAAESNRNLARLRSELGILQLRLDPPDVAGARSNFEAADEQFEWSGASPIDRARNKVALARAKLIDGLPQDAYTEAADVLANLKDDAPFVTVSALIVMGQAAFEQKKTTTATKHYHAAVAALSAIGSDRQAADSWFELGALMDEAGLTDEAHDAYRNAAAATGLVSLHALRRTAAKTR